MSYRGANTLFKDFFPEAPVISIDRKRGRSSVLIEQRNECMVHRYHYHRTRKIEGKIISYESLIETVAAEFWLSPDTIIDLIIDQHGKLKSLNNQWPVEKNPLFAKQCQKKWTHLIW